MNVRLYMVGGECNLILESILQFYMVCVCVCCNILFTVPFYLEGTNYSLKDFVIKNENIRLLALKTPLTCDDRESMNGGHVILALSC